ncbi:hypothetical protein Pmar_PMAR015541 [Perkinsus marinus ATCC 50983]|uniref:FLYWCH-type domain-containing protein n=1 Tax=Perkinsus marinus (strain ATCC 50983 / TXsc) TaxID=423536 RepID=C5M1L2_PERM5|nr:hypothetical protein Pmar_PMAR015541 [Perkinsus marinus ATCC 50983]EEQ97128.1 hypothetical protein Pmar_PMAR015541 [Perkinsus marinus ATCC 50983]|eukprot:XP_002764411.1 hypothetical protein Pmar_PMAR015541 [Perkinsus marinus ATCC 50983]
MSAYQAVHQYAPHLLQRVPVLRLTDDGLVDYGEEAPVPQAPPAQAPPAPQGVPVDAGAAAAAAEVESVNESEGDAEGVLHGDIPIPEGWISSTNNNKPSIWINKQQYRFKKGLEDSKSRYECCSKKCYASFTVQVRNDRLYFTRRPGAHGAECDREPDEGRETQTRQRRRIQAEVANNGRTDGLVEGIIADGGLANTTLRDQRNLEQVAYRAARAQGQPAALKSLDLDRVGYYQDFVNLVQRDVDKCRGNDQRLLLHADAGRPMIIWAADRNINALNGSSGLIFDATFAVAPKGWQQLWVILIEKQGYYIPAVFILMARRPGRV